MDSCCLEKQEINYKAATCMITKDAFLDESMRRKTRVPAIIENSPVRLRPADSVLSTHKREETPCMVEQQRCPTTAQQEIAISGRLHTRRRVPSAIAAA